MTTLQREQEELAKYARSFLASRAMHYSAPSPDADNSDLYQDFGRMGWHGIGVPESAGGNGGSWVELGLLLEEMGRALVSSPFFASTVIAAQAIAAVGTPEEARDLIERITAGELTATMALPGRGGSWRQPQSSVQAERVGAGWTVRGTLHNVIDGATADLLLLVATTADGMRLMSVDTSNHTVEVTRAESLDPSRPLASVRLNAAPAKALGGAALTEQRLLGVLDRVLDLVSIALAAEQLGSAQHCLDQAVAYARIREQHGQAIGSQQAVKHRCVDAFLAIESARSAVHHALEMAAQLADGDVEGHPNVRACAASVARLLASRAATRAALDSIQIHGGIGVTWEHSAHRYLKRAKSCEFLAGGVNWHRERLGRLVVLQEDPSFTEPLLPPERHEEVQAFGQQVRRFLAEQLPADWVSVGALAADQRTEWLRVWRKKLSDHGMICVSWPVEYGGQGRSTAENIALLEEFTQAGVPSSLPVDTLSLNLLGPTLLALGTESQKAELLPRIVTGEDRWCQGYSEPAAGSDLAAVQTSATLKDGKWVVNGQKLWTSYAHEANWMFALVRTDKTASKHAGLSFLLIPLDQPGVDIRPILDLSGRHHINEVFLTDAETDEANIVGEVNGGWAVATTLLDFERSDAAIRDALNLRDELQRLLAMARESGRAEDPIIRSALVDAYLDLRAIVLGAVRSASAAMAGQPPGPESSMHKLLWSEYHQRVTTLALEVLADEALTLRGNPSATKVNTDIARTPASSRSWIETFLAARAGTIYAGTSEIQRNILAERVLLLPRAPRPAPKEVRQSPGPAS